MKRIFYIFPWILLGTVLFFYTLALFAPVSRVDDLSLSLSLLRDIYEKVGKVNPSRLTPQLLKVVQQRIECYKKTPTVRLDGFCTSDYLERLASIGRAEIASAPQLGRFLIRARFCPIVYSICMGEEQPDEASKYGQSGELEYETYPYTGDDNECNKMESRCIDAVLDTYWRGAPTWNPSF